MLTSFSLFSLSVFGLAGSAHPLQRPTPPPSPCCHRHLSKAPCQNLSQNLRNASRSCENGCQAVLSMPPLWGKHPVKQPMQYAGHTAHCNVEYNIITRTVAHCLYQGDNKLRKYYYYPLALAATTPTTPTATTSHSQLHTNLLRPPPHLPLLAAACLCAH